MPWSGKHVKEGKHPVLIRTSGSRYSSCTIGQVASSFLTEGNAAGALQIVTALTKFVPTSRVLSHRDGITSTLKMFEYAVYSCLGFRSQTQQQSECSSGREWLFKWWYIHHVEYITVIYKWDIQIWKPSETLVRVSRNSVCVCVCVRQHREDFGRIYNKLLTIVISGWGDTVGLYHVVYIHLCILKLAWISISSV